MSAFRLTQWLRTKVRPVRRPVRRFIDNARRCLPAIRLSLHALDDRILPSITEFSLPAPNHGPAGITRGPDGNIWFTEVEALNGNRIGRITQMGQITEFAAGITPGSQPFDITVGPDGNLWFTETADRIGRITPSGQVTEFSVGITAGSQPSGIVTGPDGNLWFTEPLGPNGVGAIARITPTGFVTEFRTGLSPGVEPFEITVGSDHNLWFTELLGGVGRITTTGVITEFMAGITPGFQPDGIAAGPDGNLWFTEFGGKIARITTTGQVTEFSAGLTPGASPGGITPGADDILWFTESNGSRIGSINTAGQITEFSAGITPGSGPFEITSGPGGTLWFTELDGNRIARFGLAPLVASVVINGGAAQRSMVTQLQITFDQHVILPANPVDAFRLARQGDGAVVTLRAAVDDTATGTIVTLQFAGLATEGNSLADGRYTFTAVAGQISDKDGALDGDGDGIGGDDFVFVGNTTTNKLFRLFGDASGDGTVNSTDFAMFRIFFGLGASIFDFNNDDQTNSNDFAEFRKRFGISIAP